MSAPTGEPVSGRASVPAGMKITGPAPAQRALAGFDEPSTVVLDAPPPPRPPRTVPTDQEPPRRPARRVVPRPKWVVAAVLVFVFVSLLLVEAYANARFTPDHQGETGETTIVPDQIIDGGPIINAPAGQEARSYRLPAKTIALTFDDGPDPTWTPRVLATLDRYGAKGTFFVIGSQVVRSPELASELVHKGHELGVHTFTHPDVATLPQWRRRMEYSQTQLALAEAAGVRSSLLRFPYSSKADAIDDAAWRLITQAGALGYVTVVNDKDSQDWARPGVDQIVANMIPDGDEGAVVLLHDSGGDRAQTVQALDRFIPMMQARGYSFVTVTDGLRRALTDPETGAAPTVLRNPPAGVADRQRGLALAIAVRIADWSLDFFAVLFLVVGVLTLARTLLLFVLSGRQARRRRGDWSWGPPVTKPVSVIVPAYNEREGIEAAVRSLAGGDHPGGIEVIVVDDGSTDDTADIAESLGLPNVRVIRKPNGGKSSALNTGVAAARSDIIVMVDGDTVFEHDSVRQLVQPFADPEVGAVAGNVKVGNRATLVARWQHIEYVIGFNLDRRLYESLRCMPTVPGAIGAWRKDALLGVGGMSDDTLAEDTDVTIAFGRAGWKVVYEGRARAWTEAPASLSQLWRQRYRWSYGTMQAMWKHRRALVDDGPSGRFGRRGLPFLALFGIALPLLAPVIDLLAVYALLFAGRTETVLAWLAMLGLQLITGVVAFRLDKERLTPLWTLPLQQFAYRQLMYLVLIQSLVTALTGGRLRWHKLRRTGEASVQT
ncbi:bifunctional polysaccharide deacetylase/glycosyltransferase family 2 protein [Asanoa iriomotensis]|uniref:Bi-functional transferase/deacetylase n=1 Tax=Asanoa iriomotensis TaxID=234613 RepID=A0ABQ4BY21_9ACTN|nr:bifunctional polysaccharide deacetylase/glycosyltransferase family 2 protein [Asanoa iriomotensis]GIF55416.1 bi-functional transferase/deacetylase [Asanoa iriomotensis]